MKFKLFDKEGLTPVAEGIAERIGIDNGNFVLEFGDEEIQISQDFKNHSEAISLLKEQLISNKLLDDMNDLEGIGHRVVQGGEIFKESSLLDDKKIEQINELSKLAPLHNPGAYAVMKACLEYAPNAKNVAVFDTSYHQTMPSTSYKYAVPTEWYDKYAVRRYGAHGTSYRYITQVMQEVLKKESINIITLHLGNGASLAAIKDSKSYNTSMGLTPLAGIPMGTRSGDIDPSILEYMVNETGKTISEITNQLNKESGILALSGVGSDFRDILAAIKSGDKRANEALEIYAKRIAEFVVKYQNDLENKVDAIIFTAGIGENAAPVRERIIENIHTMNVKINNEVNNTRSKEKVVKISAEESSVPIFVVKTDEELMIVRDVVKYANL